MAKTNKRIYAIKIREKAEKDLLKIPLPWQERIRDAIDVLELDPFYGEKMWGEFANCRKIKVWPYRIIYEIKKKERIIYICRLDNRSHVYK